MINSFWSYIKTSFAQTPSYPCTVKHPCTVKQPTSLVYVQWSSRMYCNWCCSTCYRPPPPSNVVPDPKNPPVLPVTPLRRNGQEIGSKAPPNTAPQHPAHQPVKGLERDDIEKWRKGVLKKDPPQDGATNPGPSAQQAVRGLRPDIVRWQRGVSKEGPSQDGATNPSHSRSAQQPVMPLQPNVVKWLNNVPPGAHPNTVAGPRPIGTHDQRPPGGGTTHKDESKGKTEDERRKKGDVSKCLIRSMIVSDIFVTQGKD